MPDADQSLEALPQFWAKTNADGEPAISVRDHCLNVGAVAGALIEILPLNVSGLVPCGAVTLAALHDIGKITPGFQAKCDAWIYRHGLVPDAIAGQWKTGCEPDHAKVSQWTLQDLFNRNEELFGWAVAVGSHHGKIKGQRITKYNLSGSIGGENWNRSRLNLAKEIVDHFGPLPTRAPPSEAQLWWLAGLITVADWVGSDESFFPLDGSTTDADRSARAAAALNEIQWRPIALRHNLSFDDLFPGFTATALQRAAFEQITQPGVYLIEAPMGWGKTEAALGAAYKLISNDHASGLYFALPTQITSNKIHERVENFIRQIEIDRQQVRLAHSSAWLQEDCYVPRIDEARSWFASSKRALLCPFGVGTVDQALLGIVAAKHFFLRQFGLAGKIVILDEIHSYDLYTGTLIEQLVERLRQLRCTVLILSATLTSRRREDLLRAAGAKRVTDGNAYPLLTLAQEGAETKSLPFPTAEARHVDVLTTTDSDSVEAELCVEHAAAGQCVLWIRNTVADAQSSFRLLKNLNHQDGPPIGLLHSRFPLWRREELESFWLEALGKTSTTRPAGCVLVATQVVEQSVDIDADLLVTDLAPTDMLLQRIGRLWRHSRLERTGKPSTIIHTLGLTNDNYRCGSASDLKALLGRTRRVYAPYVLLRTFENWIHRSRIALPSDIRPLLEKTYCDPCAVEPEGWSELRRELQTRSEKLRNSAVSAALILRQPALADEEGVQTRISDMPTVQMLLAAGDPVRSPKGTISVLMVDGTNALVPDSRFDLPAARAVHRNLVRIPAWAVNGLSTIPPEWLSRLVSQNAVLGVVRDNGAIFINRSASGMTWHRDEGVTLTSTYQTVSPDPTVDDEYYD